MRALLSLLILTLGLAGPRPLDAQAPAAPRPMSFLDMQQMRQIGAPTPSPDGRWLLYTLSTPDWKEAKRQTDVYLVSLQQGVASTRQMTFTKDKNETSPRWARDGSFFVFLSNREAPEDAATRNQLYLMRPDGGESRRISDAKEGVTDYDLTRDGKWLVYRSGKSGEEQLYRLPIATIDSASPEEITKHDTGIGTWKLAPDSARIYFVTPDLVDQDEKSRREKKFTVNIRNADTPLGSLWMIDLDSRATTRLTEGGKFSAADFSISNDGKWIGLRGRSPDRYKRGITQENLYADLYLLDTSTRALERLTTNDEVGEGNLSFSPDSKWIAFSAPDDLTRFGMSNSRLYLRAVSDRDKPFRKLGESFDGDVGVGFWSSDNNTIYFNEGIRATNQLVALDVRQNTVKPVTNEKASLTVNRDDDSGAILINFSDSQTPPTLFTVDSVDKVSARSNWRQLTDANPQVAASRLDRKRRLPGSPRMGRWLGACSSDPSAIARDSDIRSSSQFTADPRVPMC